MSKPPSNRTNLYDRISSLQATMNCMTLRLEHFHYEFQKQIDAEIDRNAKAKRKLSQKQVIEFHKRLMVSRDEYLANIGEELSDSIRGKKTELPNCEKLLTAIRYDLSMITKDLVFNAISELEMYKWSLKKNRQQPDKPITKWVRQHRYKYKSNKAAVRAYVEIHGGNVEKLYSDLRNDLKKNPLRKPKNEA